MSITCEIYNRTYGSFYPENLNNPYKNKIFNGDKITIDNNIITIENSPVRNLIIHGVLHISNNKTFGKLKNKFYYKCYPENNKLPIFLVPYEIKNKEFSNKINNLFCSFKFKSWDSEHPNGELVNVFGSVKDYDRYSEYYLSYYE